ncbi:MAG: SH3 domain-containing protein [Anaerolineaceae bacterium]|nr:SH3 domain-containing protein [Anaerolineaceae bacterium]
MTRAFGIDISKHQANAEGTRRINFEIIKNHAEPVSFIAARSGVSWGYRDPQFSYHWSQMGQLKIGRIAYHVIYFGESAVAQMDSLFKMLANKSDWAHDRIALDLEVAGINTRARITSTTLNCLEICKSRTGRFPIVYSRANWVDANLQLGDLPKLDWWLATYRRSAPSPFYTSEHPGPPFLPKGVSTYLIHQTSDRGKAIGAFSHYMDYNRWNGDSNAVRQYFNNPTGYLDIPGPAVLFRAKCMVNSLRKREGPGTSFKIIGKLNLGEIVSVYEEDEGWFRLDPKDEVWCSGAGNYMQRLPAEMPLVNTPEKQRAQCIVKALFTREGPGKEYKIIGNLIRNEVVTIYEIRNGWFRISPDRQVWCCGEAHYLRLVG